MSINDPEKEPNGDNHGNSSQPVYPQLSDLIFSTASNTSFNKVLTDLKRTTLSIPNRLRSIQRDAEFVSQVAAAFELPLVANERCGSWYIEPENKIQSAYFKSTDGHMAQWSFSLRRLNLQVLDTVVEYGGCVIVDSTRRGKSMPDALSKTIPIWTAVLNRLLFPDQPESHVLSTSPTVVGPSEHAQIAARLSGFVDALKTLNHDFSSIRKKMTKPLRPIWITPSSTLPPTPPSYPDFYPVILLTASSRISSESSSENSYVQGAADDAEAWAFGLTAPLFWQHKSTLLSTPEDEMEEVIKSLVRQGDGTATARLTVINPTRNVYMGTISAAEVEATEKDIVITAGPKENEILRKSCGKRYLHISLAEGKVGSRNLRHSLSSVPPFLGPLLSMTTTSSSSSSLSPSSDSLETPSVAEPTPRIITADPSGKDHAVGITLAILCLFTNPQGQLLPPKDNLTSEQQQQQQQQQSGSEGAVVLTKQSIKTKLSWISVAKPDANASRTTLQSVNAFLLG